METTENLLGDTIRHARERKKLTRQDVAKEMGVHKNTIGNWEKGDSPPKLHQVEQLCALLDITLIQLTKVSPAFASALEQLRIDKNGNGPYSTVSPSTTPGTHQRFVNDVYTMEVSAGSGSFLEEKHRLGRIRSRIEGVFRVEVVGDSMHPTLRDGMVLRAHPFTGKLLDIVTDGVYIFRQEHAFHIKRLQILPGSRVRVISDNPLYPPYDILLDDGVDFEVFGLIKL